MSLGLNECARTTVVVVVVWRTSLRVVASNDEIDSGKVFHGMTASRHR